MMARRHQLHNCLKFSLSHSRFRIFTIFQDFISIFISTFLFTAEKKVGSACLDLAFVHQHLGLRFGLCTPCVIKKISLKEGPVCQVK